MAIGLKQVRVESSNLVPSPSTIFHFLSTKNVACFNITALTENKPDCYRMWQRGTLKIESSLVAVTCSKSFLSFPRRK